MTTIYTVEILPDLYNNQWYSSKQGQQFEAQLEVRSVESVKEKVRIGFRVNQVKWIDPNHCKIISEIKVKN